jgi:hypothetical protein
MLLLPLLPAAVTTPAVKTLPHILAGNLLLSGCIAS